MREFDVFAGWLVPEKKIGRCTSFDVNPDPNAEEMALSVGGDTKKSLRNAVEIADYFRFSKAEAEASIREIQSVVKENWEAEADQLRISRNEKKRMRPAFVQ